MQIPRDSGPVQGPSPAVAPTNKIPKQSVVSKTNIGGQKVLKKLEDERSQLTLDIHELKGRLSKSSETAKASETDWGVVESQLTEKLQRLNQVVKEIQGIRATLVPDNSKESSAGQSELTEEKTDQRQQTNEFVSMVVETWSTVKESERRKTKIQNEIIALKNQITRLKEQEKDPKVMTRDKLEGKLSQDIVSAEQQLNNLEQQAKLANITQKVHYSKEGKLLLRPRSATVDRFHTPGTSREARLGIKKVLVELEKSLKAGQKEFTLSNGQAKSTPEILSLIYSTEYGRLIIDNSSALRKEMATLAYEGNFGDALKEAGDMNDLLNNDENKAAIEQLTKKIVDQQKMIIPSLSVTRKVRMFSTGTHTRAELLVKVKEKITREEITDFYNKLGIDTGGVSDADLLASMVDLIFDPSQALVFEAGKGVTIQGELKKASGKTGLQKSINEIQNRMIPENQIQLVSRDGGNDSAAALMQMTTIGKYKEKTQACIQALVDRNIALSGLSPEEFQAGMKEAFPSQKGLVNPPPLNWNKAFEVLKDLNNLLRS